MKIFKKTKEYPGERAWGDTQNVDIKFNGEVFDNTFRGYEEKYSSEFHYLYIKDYSSYEEYPVYGLYDGDYQHFFGSKKEMDLKRAQFPNLELRKTNNTYFKKK